MIKRGIIIVMMVVTLATLRSNAADSQPQLIKMKSTAYCLEGVTASGQYVWNGICACGDPALFGKTVILYQRLPDNNIGDIIGIYEVLDTGCASTVIDVWCKDLDACQEYMNRVYEDGCKGRVYVQAIDAEG